MALYEDQGGKDVGKEALKRTERIKKRVYNYSANLGVKTSFTCQFCGCTTKKSTGESFPTNNSLAQHESWCEKNPFSRRKGKNNIVALGKVKVIPPEVTANVEFKRILELSEKLNLSREQILDLIKFKMGEK